MLQYVLVTTNKIPRDRFFYCLPFLSKACEEPWAAENPNEMPAQLLEIDTALCFDLVHFFHTGETSYFTISSIVLVSLD